MGKGNYTVCQNAACKPFDNPRMRSWRMDKNLQPGDCCKYCDTPFILKSRKDKEGWKVQDGKGRARRVSFKDNEQDYVGGFDFDARVEKFVRDKLNAMEDESKKTEILQAILPTPKPKPKSEGATFKDAVSEVNKANSDVEHKVRNLQSMQSTYLERCKALILYKEKVDAQDFLVTEAQQKLADAKKAFAELQAQDAPVPSQIPIPILAAAQAAVGQYNPGPQIGQIILSIPELSTLEPTVLTTVQEKLASSMVPMVQSHFKELTNDIVSPPPAPVEAVPPAAASEDSLELFEPDAPMKGENKTGRQDKDDEQEEGRRTRAKTEHGQRPRTPHAPRGPTNPGSQGNSEDSSGAEWGDPAAIISAAQSMANAAAAQEEAKVACTGEGGQCL